MSAVMKNLKSAGEAAYDRVRPLIEKARKDLVTLSSAVAAEYDRLQNGEKQIFCEKLGWSQDRVRQFAKVGREYPAKQAVITRTRRGAGAQLEDLGISHMVEITKTDDRLLKKAAKAGMFDHPVSTRDISNLRETGAVPRRETPTPVLSPLHRIKRVFEDAELDLNRAYGRVSKIRQLMEAHGVEAVGGVEVRRFFRSFELLCAEIAAADPAKTKEALKTLRGQR